MKQLIPQEFCLKCQGCCRFSQEDSVWSPSLLDSEIENLSKEGLSASLISPAKKIRVASFSKEDVFICSLFNPEENKCKIYNFRPLECQLYPFIINRRDKKIFLAVDPNCSFVSGKIESPELKEYSQYLAELLKSSPYCDILKNNPQIIQAYTQALDLIEL